MKQLSLLLLVVISTVSAYAQTKKAIIEAPRPKVGVVLGGGGAKGASHIGVLKYIEEMGIPIDYMAGTSMGSIIGGLYAMGYSPDELTQLISNVDWSSYIGNKIDRTLMSEEARKRSSTTLINMPFGLGSLFDKNPNSSIIDQLPSAYVNNSSLVNLFNDLCIGYQEEMDFNDMPIPFACVATDIVTGDEVVLRNGSVPTAMRSSMAIPGVFSPVNIGDMVLVDGGLVNNFPADVLKEMGADIIIGVEVTNEKRITREDIQSLPQLLGRLVTNSTNSKRKENRELCNVHIVPDVSGFGMLSFSPDAIDTLVHRGYKKAAEYHDQLLAIKQHLDEKAGHPVGKELHAPKAHNLKVDSIPIGFIEFDNVSAHDSRWLMRKGGLNVGGRYTEKDIGHAISVYRGTGCFDEITYTVKEHDSIHQNDQLAESYDLTIHMTPAKPSVLGLGFRYDTEEGTALLLNIGLNEKKFSGSKFKASVKLSYNPRFNATYTYSRSSLANFNLAFDYRNQHFTIADNELKKDYNLHFKQQKLSGYISQFHLLNISAAVGVSYYHTTFDLVHTEGPEYDSIIAVIYSTNDIIAPYINFEYDNLDHAYFAKRGLFARVAGHYYFLPKTKERFGDISTAFQYYLTPANGKFTIIPQAYSRFVFGSPYYFNLMNFCGGEIAGRHFEEQMPFIGISHMEQLDYDASIFRCDLRYNFIGKHYLTATYNLLCQWTLHKSASGVGLRYSYNSLLGPISLTALWSNYYSSGFGLYFSFGYTF